MAFAADHRLPAGGLPAWDAPDPTRQPVATIGAGLLVQLLEQRPDGWAQVLCDNGWAGWVDGRRLEALAAPAPPAPAPTAPAPTASAPAPATAAPYAPAASAVAPSAAALRAPLRIAGVRLTTQLVGGALIVVACFLPWVSVAGGFASENGFGVPLKVLFDPESQSPGGLKIGFVTIVLGALTVAAGLKRLPLIVGRVAGGAAMLIATMFLAQLQRAMGQAQVGTVFGVLGMGVYLTMLGGVASAMSKGSPS